MLETVTDHTHRNCNNESTLQLSKSHTIRNPVCRLLFPSKIQLIHHHKTGTVMSRKLLREIDRFCESQWNGKQHYEFLIFIGYAEFNKPNIHHGITHYHFIRDPVLTIISSFHYHKYCTEGFATHPFSIEHIEYAKQFFSNSTDMNEIRSIYDSLLYGFWNDLKANKIEEVKYVDKTSKFQKLMLRQFWDRRIGRMGIRYLYIYYMQYLAFSIDVKAHGKFYGFDLDLLNDDALSNVIDRFNVFKNGSNYNEFMQQFDGKLIKYGLYFSMIRYLFVVYPEIYDVHHRILNQEERKYHEFRMEDWINDFNGTAHKLLDALNFVDSVENREILRQNGCGDIDIEKERNELTKALSVQDTSKYNALSKRNRHKQDVRHIHIHRNNTKYIHELLTMNEQICLMLKHVTILIDYDWRYSEYC